MDEKQFPSSKRYQVNATRENGSEIGHAIHGSAKPKRMINGKAELIHFERPTRASRPGGSKTSEANPKDLTETIAIIALKHQDGFLPSPRKWQEKDYPIT
jgi:hypothetical protein